MATRKKKAKSTEPDFEPAVVHDFVTVVAGDHEGRYGVVIGENQSGQFVIRARDSNSDVFVVDALDVRKSEAGLR